MQLQAMKHLLTGNNSVEDFELDDEHLDLFDELNAILGETDKN